MNLTNEGSNTAGVCRGESSASRDTEPIGHPQSQLQKNFFEATLSLATCLSTRSPASTIRRFLDTPEVFIPLAMLKRRVAAPKTVRKRKKGNTTFTSGSLDPPIEDEMVVEHVRVWDVSTSENTGRISANRRTVKHYRHVSPTRPEESLTKTNPEGDEGNNVEEAGILGDSESPLGITNKRLKRKSVKALKDNDSVSDCWPCLLPILIRVSRRRWKCGFSTVRLF